MGYINILGKFVRLGAIRTLAFAASGLSMCTGYAPLASNHGEGHAFCLHAHPGITCPSPYIRNFMKNPA